MFPELKPLFQDAYDQARAGTVYCVARYRDKAVNLRTQMNEIIKRAGLTPWAKTFQNLRSTRETELFKLTGGNVKAVCTWIGNTPAVAMQHYAQVTEADMKEAAKLSVMEFAKKTVQDPVHDSVQQTPVAVRKRSQESSQKGKVSPSVCSGLQQKNTGLLLFSKSRPVGRAGLEPSEPTTGR